MDSSSSSNASYVGDYDVFLSFRGVDTRQGFTAVLHELMTMVEIRVFRDDDELKIGDKIESILEAINSSKICIPIFSPRFAESKWCLREVSRMVDLKKTIVPIFYKVTPDDVKLKGASVYSDDFTKLEENHGNIQEVDKWKKALKEAASNKGRTLGEMSYTRFSKEFVDEVLSELGPRKRLDLDYFVGDKNKEAAMELLEMGSSTKEVVCVALRGMGGIGKTTTTKLIYNELLSKFDHCAFLPDIREFSKRKGIKDLPTHLYDNLEPKSSVAFSRSEQIPSIFKNKKVLLILDDVDSYKQIKKIARVPNWFGSGSRIILTTRDKKVVEDYIKKSGSEIRDLEMRELDHGWGLELFSKCAFGTISPPSQYQELSKTVVAYSGGLPLTITVAGKFLLNQKKVEVWKDFIERLRKSPLKKVKDKLMISYESLEDEQKTIFLDIACFFSNDWSIDGEDSMFCMWQACSLLPHLSLQVLQSRSLLKFDEDNVVWMHDQLKDLGKDIVKKNSKCDVTQQSRLWERRDIVEVLKCKEKKKNIEGIHLWEGDMNDMHKYEFSGFDNLRFLVLGRPSRVSKICGTLPKLKWLSLGGSFDVGNLVIPNLVALELCGINVDDNWIERVQIQGLGLESLKFFHISFYGEYEGSPVFTQSMAALEIFSIDGCKLAYIDSSIDKLQNLTSLTLSSCQVLRELPEELGCLGNLTTLNLSHCNSLSEIPESLGDLHSLRELDLGYTCIDSLPLSIGRLKNLQCLNLYNCSYLVSLPETFGNLHSLTELDLSATGITTLPDFVGELKNLERLCLMRCKSLVRISKTIGNLHSLKMLFLRGGTSFTSLPDSIGELQKLERLHLSSVTSLPDSIGNLQSLVDFKLSDSKIRKLPSTITQLSLLQIFNLEGCSQLHELPELPTSLTKLVVEPPRNLKHILTSSTDQPGIKHPQEGGEYLALGTVHDLSNLQDLTSLELTGGDILDWGGSFPANLKTLAIYISSISKLPHLINCSQLTKFVLQCGYSLKVLPNLSGLRNLEGLYIYYCSNLIEIPGIGNLQSLTSFHIRYCRSLVSLENVGELKELRTFYLTGCRMLTEIPGLGRLRSLTELRVEDCYSIERLDNISGLEDLEKLSLRDCDKLTKIPGLFNLKSLKSDVRDCCSGEILRAASQLHGVEVMPNSSLNNVDGIYNPVNLQSLPKHICGSSSNQMEEMAGHMEVNNGNRHHQQLDLNISLNSLQDDQATNQSEAADFPKGYNHKKRKGDCLD